MSRFADPHATTVIPIGPCDCPGKPHEQDEAVARTEIGASAKARVGRAEIEGAVQHDPLAAHRQLVLETVVSWNLLWLAPAADDGAERVTVPVPITPGTVAELDRDTLIGLAEAIDKYTSESDLPNASGAPSRALRRGSASRIRTKTPTRGT
jgi:hypothetical protein